MSNSNQIPKWATDSDATTESIRFTVVDFIALWLKAPIATSPWVNDLIRQAHEYHEKRSNVVATPSRVSYARPPVNNG